MQNGLDSRSNISLNLRSDKRIRAPRNITPCENIEPPRCKFCDCKSISVRQAATQADTASSSKKV